MIWTYAYLAVAAVAWPVFVVATAKHHRRSYPSFGWDGADTGFSVFIGFCAALIWPLSGLVALVGPLIHRALGRALDREQSRG